VADGRVYVRSTAFVAAFDFSVPDLKLDARAIEDGQLTITAGTVTGAPVGSNRFAGLELRASDTLSQPPGSWVKLTNSLALTNGSVRAQDPPSGPQRFYILSEPR
jgi:hypothetical protein